MELTYPEKIREDNIDGFCPWYWPEEDTGAWDGPVRDWLVSHKTVISTLKNRRTVIQAGGNCGLYPVLLSPMFNRVITFEPDASNYYFLTKNIKRSHATNITAYNNAVGFQSTRVGLSRPTSANVGMHRIDEGKDEVDMVRIDDLHIPEVDLLWLDIEGYEEHAIMGALWTIKENKPMIGLEYPSSDLIKFIENMGYKRLTNSEMDVFYVYQE